jgi:hypothetical protein
MSATHARQGRVARALERRFGRRYQQFLFWRALRRFLREAAHGAHEFDRHLLAELVAGWGEPSRAHPEFLAAILQQVRETEGPVLECGSGLSTLLIGAVAKARGIRVYSVEHEPRTAARVQARLRKHHIGSASVLTAPIRSYGDFDWYALPSLQTVPGRLPLVICHGPPPGTRGGRFGLVPVMMEKLRPDVIILLGDGGGDRDRATAERWGQMLGGNPELIGSEQPYLRLKAGRTSNPLQMAPIAENPTLQDDLPPGTGPSENEVPENEPPGNGFPGRA